MKQVVGSHRYAFEQWQDFETRMNSINDGFLTRGGLAIFQAGSTRIYTQSEQVVIIDHFGVIVREMVAYLDSLPTIAGINQQPGELLPPNFALLNDETEACETRGRLQR
jgi:hypothetical protein